MSMYSQNQDLSVYSRNSQPLINAQSSREEPFKIFDFLFPGSHSAKLVRVYDAYAKNFPFKDILRRLNLQGGSPIVNIIGGKSSQNKTKLYGGIARACFNTDAIIIDSAISSGIEKHALRMGVKLVGVAPENEVQFPKVNSTFNDPSEISQGHTHLFLINNPENDLQWTQESLFRATLALRLAEGDFAFSGVYQRVVNVLIGDTPNYIDDIRLAVKFQQPILIAPGSRLCNQIIEAFSSGIQSLASLSQELADLMMNNMQYFFMLLESNSDEVAQYVHFFLTVTPYKQTTPMLYLAKQHADRFIPTDADYSPVNSNKKQMNNYQEDDLLRQQEEQEQMQLQHELQQQQAHKLSQQSLQHQQQQSQQQQQQSSSQQLLGQLQNSYNSIQQQQHPDQHNQNSQQQQQYQQQPFNQQSQMPQQQSQQQQQPFNQQQQQQQSQQQQQQQPFNEQSQMSQQQQQQSQSPPNQQHQQVPSQSQQIKPA